MPEPLSEMNNLSIINPQYSMGGSPRYSNPPPPQQSYQNYTVLDDVFSCQTQLPPSNIRDTPMPPYNSNGVFPAYHQAVCPPYAQQGLMNLQAQGYTPNNNVYVANNQPSYQTFVDGYLQQAPNMYSTNFQYPPFAGSVPEMKNARAADASVAINMPLPYPSPAEVKVEGYAAPLPTQPTQSCIECAKHVSECGLCTKLTKCSNTKWWIAIGILVLIIIFLVMYIFFKHRGGSKGSSMPRMKFALPSRGSTSSSSTGSSCTNNLCSLPSTSSSSSSSSGPSPRMYY